MAAVIGSLRAELSATVAKFEKDLGKAADAVRDASKRLTVVGNDWRKVGAQMQAVGSGLTKTLTVPLAGLGVAAARVAVNFDEAMDEIRAGTGATGEELDRLGHSFRNVFAKVPNEIQDVSRAIADLSTRTGLSGQPLETLATQMLNVSRLTKTSIGDAIAATTRVFGDWSVATNQQSQSLDYLFRVSQNTGIGFNRLSELVVQFGAPMRALGFSFEQTAALMGKFEKEGVNLETVMSGLRFALGKFAASGREPAQAFAHVTRAIQQAKTESEATQIAFENFGRRAAVDISRAVIEGRFNIEDLVRTLQTSKDTINDAARDTLSFGERWRLASHQIQAAIEPLGTRLLDVLEGLQPAIETGAKVLASLVEGFSNLPRGTQVAIIGIAGFAAALGPIVFIGGQVVSSVSAIVLAFGKAGFAARALVGLLTGASGLVGGLKATTVAIEGASLASKGLLLGLGGVVSILAGGALLVGLKQYLDLKNKLDTPSKSGQFLPGLTDGLGNAKAAAEDLKKGLVDITQTVQQIGPKVSVSAKTLGEFGKSAESAAAALGEGLGEAAYVSEEALKKAKKSAEEFKEALADVTSHGGSFHDILKTINAETVEAIAFYLRHGAAVNKLAVVYGLTEAQIEAVADQLRFQESVIKQSSKSFVQLGVDVSAAARHAEQFREQFRGLTRDNIIAAESVDYVSQVFDQNRRAVGASTNVLQDVGEAAQRAGEKFHELRQEVEDASNFSFAKLASAFSDALGDLNRVFEAAFEGGGGLLGAIQSIGTRITADVLGLIPVVGGALSKFAGAIVSGLKKIGDLFSTSPGEDVVKSVRTWGIKISEELGNSIAETAKTIFRGNRRVAEVFRLGDIIDAAGGIDDKNVKQLLARFRDVFVFVSGGMMTSAQGAKVLDDNFQAFANHFLANSKLISKELVEIIRLNDEWGTKSKAIQDFVSGQLTTTVIPGLQAFTGATRTASGAIAENEGTLKGLTQELRETEKRLIDLALAQDKAAEKGDTDEVERLSGEIARLTQEQATLNQEILTVNSTIATQRGLLDTLKISSQGAADALSASVGAAFSKLVDAGVPVLDVVDQLEPVVSELGASFQSAGFEGSTAFQQLQATMALAKDEIAGPAITAVTGLGNVLAGLSNTGLLTQDMFSGLTGQITSTFGTLIAGGADGETALRLMQDPLQTVYELSQEFGFAVDESTQALVEQAKEQGIVGEKFKSVQKQMLDATNKLVSAIERLANSFTGSLARQAEAGARSVQRSLDGIEAPSLTIEIDYSDPGFTPNVSGGEYPEFQHGSGGIRNFGTGTLAMLHGREAVLTEHQLNRVGGRNSKAVVVNLSVEPHFHGVFTNDPVGLRTVSRDVLAPQLVSSLTRDDAGLVKAIKKAIGR